MTTVAWLIDTTLQERQYECGFPSLADAAREAGHTVSEVKYVPFSDPIELTDNNPVVVHGCIEFNKKRRGGTPGAYFNDNVKLFSKFAPHIGDDLLSGDYVILPYGEFVRRKMVDRFIKPLSGLKEFTGQVASWNDSLSHIHIEPETLCVIASPIKIQSEFRYIIAERKVITGSEYRWDDVLDVRMDTLPECDALAQKIAAAPWQADIVYVCDVAMTELGPKVIELNAFSSSGLYACDTRKIVKAVGEAATKEWRGEIGIGE